jgi:hypothetical protein
MNSNLHNNDAFIIMLNTQLSKLIKVSETDKILTRFSSI